MNQQELEALIATIAPNNDPRRLEFSESTETVEVEEPPTSQYTQPTKRKKPVRTLTWVDRGTGQTLKVQQNDDGSYTQTFRGVDPKMQGAPAVTPAQQQAQEPSSDTKPLEGYPGWNTRTTKVGNDTRTIFVNPQGQEAPDPRPSAAAGASDTKPVEGHPGWSVRTTKVGNDTRTIFINPQGQEAPDPRPASAAAVVGTKLPGSRTTKTLDGKTIQVTTYQRPDGTPYEAFDTATSQVPPIQVDGRWGIWTQAEGEPSPRFVEAQMPERPAFTYPELKAQYGNITTEIAAIAKDIYSQVGTGPGKITKQEADARMQPIYEQATMRVNELNAIVSTQKGVWETQARDVEGQRRTGESRLRAATDWMQGSQAYHARAGEAGAEGGRLYGELAAMYPMAARSMAGSVGGLTDYQLPQMGGYLAQVAGAQPVAAPGVPGAPAVPPAPGPPGPPGGPNAIGLGAIGTVPAPGAATGYLSPAVPPPVPSPQAVPTAGEPGGPPLAPGPVWEPPVSGPPVRDDWRTGAPQAAPGQPQPQQGGIAPITINVGGAPQQPAAQQPQQPGYLQPAAQTQRPSLQQHQRLAAGQLMELGFPEGVVDEAWRRRTGQSLLSPGGMGAGNAGLGTAFGGFG